MKRVVCLIAAVCVCMSSTFAWNAESFLSDGSAEYQPYSFDPVNDSSFDLAQVPMMMSLDDGLSVAAESDSNLSLSGLDLFNCLSLSPSTNGGSAIAYRYTDDINIGSDVIPGYRVLVSYPRSTTSLYLGKQTGRLFVQLNDIDIPYRDSTSTLESVYGVGYGAVGSAFDSVFPVLDVDFSSLGSFDVFELSGVVRLRNYLYRSGLGFFYQNYQGLQFIVYVNGQEVHRFNTSSDGTLDFGNFVYRAGQRIESLSFGLYFPPYSYAVDEDEDFFGILGVDLSIVDGFSLTVLTTNEILDGFNSEVQGDLDQHESIESQWTGSMTENFNALDLSGFTFPGGLVAAFALITGIFNDLWNGMGDYKILYVFPLTLGVVLLLIGRISKFSGRSSSGRSGKGDDSA